MSGSPLTAEGRWLDRWSDRLNPILIKEVRQAFKARMVTVSFLLALLFAWFLSLSFILEPAHPNAVRGPELFFRLMSILGFALFYLVPYISFRSMAVERERHTFEMLAVSALSNGQIFSGKFNCALLLILLFEAAFAPFICMTYMLRGLGVIEIAASLFVITIIAITLSLFGLMLGSLARKAHTQVICIFVLLAGPTLTGILMGEMMFANHGDFVGGLCCSIFFTVVIGGFSWGVTLSNLRPPTFELIRTYLEPETLQEITEAAINLATVIREQIPLSDHSPKSEWKLVPVSADSLQILYEAVFRLERLLNPRRRYNSHISRQRFLTVRGTSKALEEICVVHNYLLFRFGWAELCHKESLPERTYIPRESLPIPLRRLEVLETATAHIRNRLSEDSLELESPQP